MDRWIVRALLAVCVTAGVCVSADVPAEAQQAPGDGPAKPAARSKAVAKPAEPQAADGEGDAGTPAPAAKKKRDPAEAARTVDAGIKLLQAGKTDQAVATLSSVIAGGNLPAPVMAKAMYNRGLAYRMQGKPAQAISDLTGALWFKGGLPDAERTLALEARAAAYREAGLSDQSGGAEQPAAAPGTARPKPIANQNSSVSPIATATAAPQPKASNGGFFSSLFGGNTDIQPAAPPRPSPPPQAAQSDIGQPWSSATEVKGKGAARGPTVARPGTPQAPSVQVAAAGPWRAQVALVRGSIEALGVVDRLKSEYAGALADREPQVDQTALGNMGTFYRVRVGPYASQAEAQALCAAIKSTGLDCVPVTP